MLLTMSSVLANFSEGLAAQVGEETASIVKTEPDTWDEETDIAVVGFGGAGACAAIEGVDNGAKVTVIERFNGGGTTRASGGVVYLGGGTEYQKQAGFDDSPENMFKYLHMEARGVVKDSTLKTFCDESSENAKWLSENGVPFEGSFYKTKTSYPPGKYCLYYSGNESFPPFVEKATPAPRGHRAKGKGMSGRIYFDALRKTALKKGVNVKYQTIATGLYTDDKGNVTGVRCLAMPSGSFWTKLHGFLDSASYKLRYMTLGYPPMAHVYKGLFYLLEKNAKTISIRVRKGVILSSGGFINNRKMIAEEAPKYSPGTPLGTFGDDGSGIRLGQSVGGATGLMDRVSAWRFINPPLSFVKGVLIDMQGNRICNEQYYGARTGEKMVEEHDGKALLIIDKEIWKQAHWDITPKMAKWFQTMHGLICLYPNRTKADSIEKLSARCNIPEGKLRETIEAYNQLAQNGNKDPMGKFPEFIKELSPPYYAVDCSLGNRMFACATITLGGLLVNEVTGEVLKHDGSSIKGLYAAGRTAVGVTSRGYMSGLSIADGVFSGRRAAKHSVTGN